MIITFILALILWLDHPLREQVRNPTAGDQRGVHEGRVDEAHLDIVDMSVPIVLLLCILCSVD